VTDRERRRRLRQETSILGSQLWRKFFSAIDDDALSESGIPPF